MGNKIKKWSKKAKGAKKKKTTAVVKKYKPDPFSELYKKIPAQDGLEVEIHPLVFASIMAKFVEERPDETAGYFDVNPNGNIIDWSFNDPSADGTGGHVDYGTAEALLAYMGAFGHDAGFPNGQWHTHPNLTPYWSSTDKKAQLKTVVELMRNNKTGFYYFMVMDKLDWLITKISWEDDKIVLAENGTVLLSGVKMEKRVRHTTVTTYYKGGTHYDNLYRGGGGADDFQDDYWPYWGAGVKQLEGGNTVVVANNHKYDKHAAFKGDWSLINKDYYRLFDIFKVQKYDWNTLWNTIDSLYPDRYWEIVDSPHTWSGIKEDLEVIVK